nr:PREDICTED: uncharacterized protein LOC109434839 [Rhinolophus sinicus]XP_019567721.1 PREDICTED: uncharacterized protein LOC109434839 [Rhinolophus sinicus]XP_019567722.1 PREDICTED: uncharacterized protein LOC109434839 [Rhinolophus sinicus]
MLGPKCKVPRKCPRAPPVQPHQLWPWLGPPLPRTQALGTARRLGHRAAHRSPTLPTPPASALSLRGCPEPGERRPQAGAAHPTAGVQGGGCTGKRGGAAEIKIKPQNCLLRSWLGPKGIQATSRMSSAHRPLGQEQGEKGCQGPGPAGQEGAGAGTGADLTESVTSGPGASCGTTDVWGSLFRGGAALCTEGRLAASWPPPIVVSGTATLKTKMSPNVARCPAKHCSGRIVRPTGLEAVAACLPWAGAGRPVASLQVSGCVAPCTSELTAQPRLCNHVVSRFSSHQPRKGGVSCGAAAAQQLWAPAKDATGRQRPCWAPLQGAGRLGTMRAKSIPPEGGSATKAALAMDLLHPQWGNQKPRRMSVTPAGALPGDRVQTRTVLVLSPHPRLPGA